MCERVVGVCVVLCNSKKKKIHICNRIEKDIVKTDLDTSIKRILSNFLGKKPTGVHEGHVTNSGLRIFRGL